MRLARFDGGSTGVVCDHEGRLVVVDVAASRDVLDSGDASALGEALGDGRGGWDTLIERWDEVAPALRKLVSAGEEGIAVGRRVEDVHLEAPLPTPHVRAFALGGNFKTHLSSAMRGLGRGDGDGDGPAFLEKRRADGPWGFVVIPGTFAGPFDSVRPPAGMTKMDYEGEVAIVLASGGRGLDPTELDVWGYTAWNDFSLREPALGIGAFDRGMVNWWLEKNFDTANVCGPWLVVDEPVDLGDLSITTRVNGELRQQGNTAEMIFSFAETASHLSEFFTLKPGDMIASGTPAGTAVESGIDGPFLVDGDEVEVEVPGVGTLRNTIVAAVALVRAVPAVP